ETHQREFSDMLAAGLDFVLPVYWGEPGHPGRTTGPTAPHYWSTEGIPPMVEALERLEALGYPPLQIGMFYDTTILANADLTTPQELTVAQVGPGFKNTQYCTGGPERNCFDIDRAGGARYEGQLQQAVASGRHLLAVETWNEFSEGTDIQETVETGRQYIELTRKYVDQLKGVVASAH